MEYLYCGLTNQNN